MVRFDFIFISLLFLVSKTHGHGYLSNPSPRQVLNNGGPYGPGDIQSLAGGGPAIEQVQGHGLCGDNAQRRAFSDPASPYSAALPKVSYVSGQYMNLTVTMTAHHWGWFEFRLCIPSDGGTDLSLPLTQDCLNQYVLEMDVNHAVSNYAGKMRTGVKSPADYDGDSSIYAIEHAKCPYLPLNGPNGSCCRGGGDCSGNPKRWVLPDPSLAGLVYNMRFKLPDGITAKRAVLQWYYQTGNSIDSYPEAFWNCADIAITSASVPTTNTPTNAPVTNAPTTNAPVTSGCHSISPQVTDSWCIEVNCDPVYADFCSTGTSAPTTKPSTAKPTKKKPGRKLYFIK